MSGLHDMHCHLDFMANAEEVAAEAGESGMLLFANTVTPEGWMDARRRFGSFPGIAIGFGMHPWWVDFTAQPEADIPRTESQRADHRRRQARAEALGNAADERLEAQMAATLELLGVHDPVFIGEIGLDFGWQHLESRNAQLRMFSSIATWAASRGGKLLSLHSVKAAHETIDVLEESGAAETCDCLFHWFTGSSDQLKRAIDLGCYFSCGPRMLATRKGREYVKAIPTGKLLLETDAPSQQGERYSHAELRASLGSAAESIAAIKGESALDAIAETSRTLLTR